MHFIKRTACWVLYQKFGFAKSARSVFILFPKSTGPVAYPSQHIWQVLLGVAKQILFIFAEKLCNSTVDSLTGILFFFRDLSQPV